MNNIAKHKSILQVLRDSSPRLRKSILQNCNAKVICVLIEIIHNLLNGNIPINANQLKRLSKYKGKFRKLSKLCSDNKLKKSINTQESRKAIIQTGGALPFLIAPLIALIAKAAVGGAVSAGTGYVAKKIIDSATGEN